MKQTISVCVLLGSSFAAQLQGQIRIQPGQNIQDAVNAAAEGASFVLAPGVHRMQSVRPRNGQSFTGEPGAVMNGSRVLTTFTRDGAAWFVSGQTQQGFVHGVCRQGFERCSAPEELFIDSQRMTHVTSRSAVGPGRWHFDYNADRIYIGDDPAGRLVETSVTTFAFHGSAANVSIRGLTIEKYAPSAQHGAINGKDGTIGASGTGWIIEDNTIQLNHGAGIAIGDRMQIRRNRILRNGQIGIVGEYQRVLYNITVEDNEIAFNNEARFDSGWEAGGTKFLHTDGLTVRNNNSHDNDGPGFWTDGDNIRVLYEGNTVERNGIGIFHEISYSATIRNNTVRRNGREWDPWLWGAQILIAASSDVEVYGNTVEVDAAGGDGITLIQQNRGAGRYGPWLCLNVYVHDNTITYWGRVGESGAAADYTQSTLYGGTNRFDSNTYRVADSSFSHWHWSSGTTSFSGFRALGQEANGRVLGLPTADSTPPSAPVNLTASALSQTSVRVDWSPSTDNAGVSGYRIYRGGSQVATVSGNSYTDTGLAAGTAYSYSVAAYDAAGNVSARSAAISVTTLPAATPPPPQDTTPPVLSNIRADNIGTGTAAISWTTNEPATAGVDYGLTTAYGSSGPPRATLSTTHAITLSNLTVGATYHYRVISQDASGNRAVSGGHTFVAGTAPTPPPPVTGPASISQVVFGSGIVRSGNGNNWYTTWSDDGKQYVTSSDASGWNNAVRWNSLLARTPELATGTDGENIPTFPFVPESERSWVGQGITSVDGVLYYSIGYLSTWHSPARFLGSRLIYSPDKGRTWYRRTSMGAVVSAEIDKTKANASTMMFWNEPGGTFSQLSFLQSGQDNSAAVDSFVYVFAPSGWNSLQYLNLARVPKDRIAERSAWEYFASRNSDGSANWTRDIYQRGRVHAFPSGWAPSDMKFSWHPSVVYNPALRIYLMVASGTGKDGGPIFSGPSALAMYSAPTPWGPWTQIYFNPNWMAANGDRYYEPAISPKWISADGRTLHLTFSGTNGSYGLNVQSFRLLP